MNKTEITMIISQHKLHPSKRRGQNFLISNATRDKIIEAIGLTSRDNVLEIGPGLGALTERIVEIAGRVTAVEIDSGFFRYLAERYGKRKNFRLVHGDFLKVPVSESFTKIVSNLPYYCSSEMLFKIAQYDVAAVYVTLQKEMAQRIIARPGHSAYGALSVTLGFYYVPEILFTVSREVFYPRPGVTSSFLRLMRRAAFPLEGDDIDLFHRIVKSAFWGRRKTIRTALSESPHLETGRKDTALILAQAGINGGTRGEELGLEDYVRMVRAYKKIMQ